MMGAWILFSKFTSPSANAAPLSNSPRLGYPAAPVQIVALASGGDKVYAAAEDPILYTEARQFAFSQTSGELSDWNPRAYGGISNLVFTSNLVYLCGKLGKFEQGPNGERISRTYIASVNTIEGKLTDWNPRVSGTTIESTPVGISSMAAQSNIVFAGGQFDHVSSLSRMHIVAIDNNSGLATPWSADIQGSSGPGLVIHALTVHNRGLIVGGHFFGVGNQSRTNLAIIDTQSAEVKSLNVAPVKPIGANGYQGTVNRVAVHNEILYIAGDFTSVGGKPRAGLAAIDLQTETVTDWDPQANGEVRDLAFGPDGIYLGGQFTSVGGFNRANLAMVDYAMGKSLSWNPSLNGAVNALVLEDGRLFVGGDFTQVGTNAVSYLAVFADEGSFWFGDTNATATEFQASLFGEEGKSYIVEASTDFGTWKEITRGQPVNGRISFIDLFKTNGEFYRARLLE